MPDLDINELCFLQRMLCAMLWYPLDNQHPQLLECRRSALWLSLSQRRRSKVRRETSMSMMMS